MAGARRAALQRAAAGGWRRRLAASGGGCDKRLQPKWEWRVPVTDQAAPHTMPGADSPQRSSEVEGKEGLGGGPGGPAAGWGRQEVVRP